MWWHPKAWCQWMERKYRGRHSKKDDARVSSWKQEERKWTRDDMVTYSKCPRQRMKKTWTLHCSFREGMDIDKEEEIAVIAWAHTVGQWQWDRMAVGNAVLWSLLNVWVWTLTVYMKKLFSLLHLNRKLIQYLILLYYIQIVAAVNY